MGSPSHLTEPVPRSSRCQKNAGSGAAKQSSGVQSGAVGPIECSRDPSPLLAPRAGNQADYWSDAGLVRMAALAPGDGAILSLQTARRPRTTTVVLGVAWHRSRAVCGGQSASDDSHAGVQPRDFWPLGGHRGALLAVNSILKFFSLAIRAVLIFQVLHSIRATHNHSVAFS